MSFSRRFEGFGQGVILGSAEKEFTHFIEKGGLPAAWTIMGMSAIPTDHPLAVGMLGMHGNYGPNLLTNECDVLIVPASTVTASGVVRSIGTTSQRARRSRLRRNRISRAT